MEPLQPERRSLPRYAVDTEATVVMVNQGPSMRARIVELSLDGCRLRAERSCPLAAPASIELMFKLNGMGFRLGGTMQWTDARQTAGIRFSPLPPRRQDLLLELLAELEAEGQAKPEVVEDATAAEIHGIAALPIPPKPTLPPVVAAPPSVESPPPPTPPASRRRERRTETRHAVDSRATIYFVDVRSQIAGRILDISPSGCRIRCDERFPVGIYRRVEAEFTCDGLSFRFGGVVQCLQDKFTIGVRFLDMSTRKQEQLTELIQEIDMKSE